MNGMSCTPSRIAWSLLADFVPMSAIVSPTLSPKRTRIFMPRGHMLPIWSPPCSSRPKSRITEAGSPLFSIAQPQTPLQRSSGICPWRGSSRLSAFFTTDLLP